MSRSTSENKGKKRKKWKNNKTLDETQEGVIPNNLWTDEVKEFNRVGQVEIEVDE